MKLIIFLTIFLAIYVNSHAKTIKNNQNEYEPCSDSDECSSGLKCSKATNLCVNAKNCSDIEECVVRCAQADECPGGYKQYFACGCCSVCAKYLGIDADCSTGQKCLPELKCSEETKKCEWKGRKPRFCDTVRCANVATCPEGQKLIERNPEKDICCNYCEKQDDVKE